jgi:hypothetical protein
MKVIRYKGHRNRGYGNRLKIVAPKKEENQFGQIIFAMAAHGHAAARRLWQYNNGVQYKMRLEASIFHKLTIKKIWKDTRKSTEGFTHSILSGFPRRRFERTKITR